MAVRAANFSVMFVAALYSCNARFVSSGSSSDARYTVHVKQISEIQQLLSIYSSHNEISVLPRAVFFKARLAIQL